MVVESGECEAYQPSQGEVGQYIKLLTNASLRTVYFTGDYKEAWKHFCEKHILVRAAGGLVFDDIGRFLFIYRRGSWDLPKGKSEPGESLRTTARREVREETGLQKLTLIKKLCDTYHTYPEGSSKVLKLTCWYLMHAPGRQALVPESGEGIEKVVWVEREELGNLLQSAWPSIRDVIVGADLTP